MLARFEDESGVEVEGLALDDVAAVTARMLEYVSTFPIAPRTPRDDTVAAANARQRAALLAALEPHTAAWSPEDRAVVAAVLDVLWGVVSYERMVVDWELRPTTPSAASPGRSASLRPRCGRGVSPCSRCTERRPTRGKR